MTKDGRGLKLALLVEEISRFCTMNLTNKYAGVRARHGSQSGRRLGRLELKDSEKLGRVRARALAKSGIGSPSEGCRAPRS